MSHLRREFVKRTYNKSTPIINLQIINVNGYTPRQKLNNTIYDGDFIRKSANLKPLYKPSFKQEDIGLEF